MTLTSLVSLILVFVLTLPVSYALVFAIQEGKLPKIIDKLILKLRAKYNIIEQLFSCSYCLGFWVGMLSYLTLSYILSTIDLTLLLLVPFMGLASSAFCFIFSQITLIGMDDENIQPEELIKMKSIIEERLATQLHLPFSDEEDDLLHKEGFCESCIEEASHTKN